MSSATRWNPGSVSAPGLGKAVEGEGGSGPSMQLSPRQLELERLWHYYRCANYEGRKTDWNGNPCLDKHEQDYVATQGFVPPGFYDAGQTADLPLKFRKPSAPFYLAKVIVGRFTSLLFSQKRHPRIACDDPRTEDWLQGFAEASRLWAKMQQVRNYGGSMGSAAFGFKIVNGKPIVEVHDPRWCHPVFADREELVLESLEKKYQFKEEHWDEERGEMVEVWFWYRRVIDTEVDVVWPKVAVQDGEEPDWENEDHQAVKHQCGFCPVVWVQNTPDAEDVDGDPDCHGIYDTIETIDGLWSQANKGVVSNCDPTTIVSSDAEFSSLRKGSGNALQVEKGGSISYLEMNGTGPKAAVELAEKLEDKALMIARCVLDTNFDGPARSEEEVEQNYSNMLEQADIYREQYGERGVKRLLEMALAVGKKFGRTYIDHTGDVPKIVRGLIRLPKKRTIDEATGSVVWLERMVGEGEQIELTWPGYMTPSLDSVNKAVTAAGQAKQFALVSEESATKFVADYFQIEDVRGEVAKAKQAQQEMADAFAEQAIAAGDGGPPAPPVAKMPAGMNGKKGSF